MNYKFKFEKKSPESLGISSAGIEKFIDKLEKYGLTMHSVMIMRHGKIAAEGYYKPFDADFKHRMYSISKTFTSLAVGMLCDRGLVSLDDKIMKFFPDMEKHSVHPYIAETTVRDLLTMSTPFSDCSYLLSPGKEWTESFFTTKPQKPAGTVFLYDTSGTYILDVIVERITGKTFLQYIMDNGLCDLGFSEDAWCVKAPDGCAWGGSGVICTLRDLALFTLVFTGGGKVGEKRIVSEQYITEAVSKQVDNEETGHRTYGNAGYGYKVWVTIDGGFAFLGMGGQLMFYDRKKDIIFLCNADCQGYSSAYALIYECLYGCIIDEASNNALAENAQAYESLEKRLCNLELLKPVGAVKSDISKEVSGRCYTLSENPMGIKKLSVEFSENSGILKYENARGEKEIRFGLGEYVFGEFPETDYSGKKIGEPLGRGYRCGAAGVWGFDNSFKIYVKIIDDYFGNLVINLGFKGDEIGVFMHKTAEWFLDDYQGFAGGRDNAS